MVQLTITQVKDALHAAGVTPTQQTEIMSRIRKNPATTAWDTLLRPLADAIRVTKVCTPKARPTRRPVYDAYLQLMQRVYADITHAKRTYATPDEAHQAALQTNRTRAEAGRHALGECLSHWSTWIPPHVVAATVAAFEAMYAEEVRTHQPPGRRIHPFSTLTQRGETQRQWKTLLAQLQPHVNAGFDIDPGYVEIQTRDMDPDRAEFIARAMAKLHKERYRAAFEARKIIQRRMKSLSTDFIVPKYWVHVLDEDTRAHLRAAERAAGGDGYTRDVGVFETAPSMSSHGYITPRPADKTTAVSAEAMARKAELDAFYAKVKAEGDNEMARRIDEGDL